MFCDAPLADTEHGDDNDDWHEFSSSNVIANGKSFSSSNVNPEKIDYEEKATANSSLDRLSSESFKISSAESLEDLVSSFDKVVAKCLKTSISLDGIVPAPRIRHLDDLVEEECGNSYFSAFLTPNYLERLANVKWSDCRTRAIFLDSMHQKSSPRKDERSSRLKVSKQSRSHSSSFENDDDNDVNDGKSETSETLSSGNNEHIIDGDLHALMVSSVAEADFNDPNIVSADDVISEIEEMMRAQEEAGDVDCVGFDPDAFYPMHNGSSGEIAMIDDAAGTLDSGYDVSMTSSALSVMPNIAGSDDISFNANLSAKLKPLPLDNSGIQSCTGVTANGKFVAQSPQHSDEDVVQLFLAESLEQMSMQELEKHAERLENAIKKYSDVLVDELATRDEQIDLKETRDHFVGLVMSVQRRVRDVTSTTTPTQSAPNIGLNQGVSGSDKSKRNSPFTVIPFNPDSGPLPLEELRVLAKILQAMLDDSPAVPSLLTEYILTVLVAKENPRA